MLTRVLTAIICLVLSSIPSLAGSPVFQVSKTPSCGCCLAWVDHIRAAGYEVRTSDMDMGTLTQKKTQLGITPQYASCHTATIDGYVIEGHVPVEDIERLLKQRPEAIGLSAPGMPVGSPGMEMGSERDAYDVVLILKDGSSKLWSSYAARP